MALLTKAKAWPRGKGVVWRLRRGIEAKAWPGGQGMASRPKPRHGLEAKVWPGCQDVELSI